MKLTRQNKGLRRLCCTTLLLVFKGYSTANQTAIAVSKSTQGERSPNPQSENHRQHRGDHPRWISDGQDIDWGIVTGRADSTALRLTAAVGHGAT